MRVLNEGTVEIFKIKMFKRFYILNLRLYEDCSRRLRSHIILDFRIWNIWKNNGNPYQVKYHKVIKLIRIK